MKSLFKSLGLTDKESATFLKMLTLGAQPVSVVAKHMGMPRSTMYLIVDKLKKVRLIDVFERAGVKFVKAIPVQQIEEVLLTKKRSLDQTIEELHSKLPELEAMESQLSITPHVKFFEGKEAVMQMYETILREKNFVTVFNPELVQQALPHYYIKIADTIRSEKLKVRELLIDGKVAADYQKKYDSKFHQIKRMPKAVQFKSDTIICPEKIYMISYGEFDLSAIEIYNRSLAETQRVLFDQLWERL